jgi:hypothetical protein
MKSFISLNLTNTFLIIFSFLVIASCSESEEARIAREKAESKAAKIRIESCESRNLRACAIDPEFTYCGIKYGDSVLGSGCTSKIRNKPFSERIDFCKAEIKGEVREMCLIEEYGCAAVTGDIYCDR